VLSADDAEESSNSIDPLSVAPTEEASPADVASHWCVALDALAWCWRQTATQQLPAELEAVAMELCELTRQDAFAHLSSWRSIHSVAGLPTRKLVEQSAQVDRVTPLSQSLLPGGAHAWALYSPFAPSTDDWTSTSPKVLFCVDSSALNYLSLFLRRSLIATRVVRSVCTIGPPVIWSPPASSMPARVPSWRLVCSGPRIACRTLRLPT
jgi:hypothetical protein